jgi:hypothetical protein
MKFNAFPTLILTLTLAAPVAFAADTSPAVKTFRSKETAFEISYPATWRLQKRPGRQLFIDRLYGPGQAASFSVGVVRYTGDKKPIQDMVKTKNEKTAAMLASVAKERFPDYKILDHKPTVLGNFPAYIVRGSYSLKNPSSTYKLRGVVVFALHGDFLYRINFESSEAVFKKAKIDFDIILSSFMYK